MSIEHKRLYIKTTLWNEDDKILVEYQTIVDRFAINSDQRRRFDLDNDGENNVIGIFDSITIVHNQVWVDYILISE